MEKKCANCIYMESKNALSTLFGEYYCSNSSNIERRGFSSERVYKDVKPTSCCSLFTPKTDNGFKY